jgi:glycosyltransferase involved in cell wall biosynthesis
MSPKTSNFLRFYLGPLALVLANRKRFDAKDVFHFHRNYAAWPKLLLAPKRGRVLISYHNVTGQVLDGWLGRLGRPIRRAMLWLERRVVRLADAIICVSGRDRKAGWAESSKRAPLPPSVIPAAFDASSFRAATASPPPPAPARQVLLLGRISHQKNVPLGARDHRGAGIARGEPFSLTIAGEGEDSRDLIRRLARSPAGHLITWLGRVPHDRVPGNARSARYPAL